MTWGSWRAKSTFQMEQHEMYCVFLLNLFAVARCCVSTRRFLLHHFYSSEQFVPHPCIIYLFIYKLRLLILYIHFIRFALIALSPKGRQFLCVFLLFYRSSYPHSPVQSLAAFKWYFICPISSICIFFCCCSSLFFLHAMECGIWVYLQVSFRLCVVCVFLSIYRASLRSLRMEQQQQWWLAETKNVAMPSEQYAKFCVRMNMLWQKCAYKWLSKTTT